jgi:hypothetical protein
VNLFSAQYTGEAVLHTTPCTLYLGDIPNLLYRTGWGSGRCFALDAGSSTLDACGVSPLGSSVEDANPNPHVIPTLMEIG